MVLCEGCYNTFSAFGYTSHLAQTTRPQCIAQRKLAFDPTEDSMSGSENSGDVDNEDSEDEDEDQLPSRFQGDFFGAASDYTPGDFAWPEDDKDNGMDEDQDERREPPSQGRPTSPSPSMGSDDVDEDDATAGILDEALRPHWEPLPGPVAAVPEDPQPAPLPVDNPPTPVFSSQQRLRAEAALHQKVERVYFPSETAGRPLSDPPTAKSSSRSMSAARAGYAAYEKKIKRAVRTLQKAGSKLIKPRSDDKKVIDDESTAYAPFPSRLDWEVARWAKLRGPTSTAVSELLNIGGVRSIGVVVVCAMHDADPCSR